MFATIIRWIDFFVPTEVRDRSSTLMQARTFVFLHLAGPLLGHSVIVFLYLASPTTNWVFWAVEANLCAFWALPLAVKLSGSVSGPALASCQALVMLSLFGSFFYGGMSSPFLPWILIAILLGFFYAADRVAWMLAGVAVQLAVFTAARIDIGRFPELVPLEQTWLVNLISVVAALSYMSILTLYYENMMRESAALEAAAKTHREKARELRLAMKLAEKASLQKSVFLAKMNHELRTPLNAVIGYSEMLREELSDTPGWQDKAPDLDRINAAGRHLNALVNEVLDVSRIESDDLQVDYSKVDLPRLIDEALAAVEPLIKVHANQLVLDLASDLGEVTTDELKLRQAIVNLLSNAAKFTSKGVVTVTGERLRVDAVEMVRISVQDTGIGISPEGIAKLFKPFSQAEETTSVHFGGTGLGLALTKRFCTALGGTLGVTSEVGVGSRFWIDVPVKPAAASGASDERPLPLAA